MLLNALACIHTPTIFGLYVEPPILLLLSFISLSIMTISFIIYKIKHNPHAKQLAIITLVSTLILLSILFILISSHSSSAPDIDLAFIIIPLTISIILDALFFQHSKTYQTDPSKQKTYRILSIALAAIIGIFLLYWTLTCLNILQSPFHKSSSYQFCVNGTCYDMSSDENC